MKIKGVGVTLVILFILFFFLSNIFFIIPEGQVAVRTSVLLSKPVDDVLHPGLHFQLPYFHKLYKFDSRILLSGVYSQAVRSSDGYDLTVESQIDWRIQDPILFVRNFTNLETGKVYINAEINNFLSQKLQSFTREQLLAKDFSDTTSYIIDKSRASLHSMGIALVDLHLQNIAYSLSDQKNIINDMLKGYQALVASYNKELIVEVAEIQHKNSLEKQLILDRAREKASQIEALRVVELTNILADSTDEQKKLYELIKNLTLYQNILSNNSVQFNANRNGLLLSLEEKILKSFLPN